MMSYGAELELADINQTKGLPAGFGWDRRDYSMVNSNGIAVDPKGILYHHGGEINTPPAYSIEEQVDNFNKVMNHFPEATVNYRSNLHIHIRVPGLADNLELLKQLQKYTHTELQPLIKEIEPIPASTRKEYPVHEEYVGAVARYNRRKRSHQTFLTPKRLQYQLAATTLQEFFEREVPRSAKGDVMWHAQPRCCVNIRQLRETDTIEFRHFPGTLDVGEFRAATIWCQIYMTCALENEPLLPNWLPFSEWYKLPQFQPYVHKLEKRYKLTCGDGTVDKVTRAENIKRILDEENSSSMSRSNK